MDWAAPDFDPGKLRAYHLALLVSEEFCGCATLQLDGGAVKSHTLVHKPSSLEHGLDTLSTSNFIPEKPALVTAIALPDQSTMVPELLASEKEGSAHLDLLFGTPLDGELFDRSLEESSARVYFRNSRAILRPIFERWPMTMMYPLQLAVVRSTLARVQASKTTLLAHLAGRRLDLCIANKTGPLLTNHFDVQTPEDLLYFLLYALDRCNIAVDQTQLFYSGVGMDGIRVNLLKEYFSSISAAVHSAWAGAPQESSAYLLLSERHTCVS